MVLLCGVLCGGCDGGGGGGVVVVCGVGGVVDGDVDVDDVVGVAVDADGEVVVGGGGVCRR